MAVEGQWECSAQQLNSSAALQSFCQFLSACLAILLALWRCIHNVVGHLLGPCLCMEFVCERHLC